MSVETVAHPPINPCPFCGDKGPELDDFDGPDHPEVFVHCGSCEATGPTARVGCRDEDEEEIDLTKEAIMMWNRAAMSAPEEL
jgi:hypothetical protein